MKRERGITESLLSIVLGLEAAVLFFVTLVVFGLKILEPLPAFLGGGIAILVFALVAGLQRYRWAVGVGAVLQLGLIALGVLTPVMFLIGAGFAAFWLWCFLRARQVEQARASATFESATEGEHS